MLERRGLLKTVLLSEEEAQENDGTISEES